MKYLKPIAVILVAVLNIANVLIYFDYYKSATESLFSNVVFNPYWFNVQTIVILSGQLFELALVFVYLIAIVQSVKDKAYQLLRFYFVIHFIFYLPFSMLYFINYGSYEVEGQAWYLFFHILLRAIGLFCVFVFLKLKPDRAVERIDINDYELVSFTSTGHRFVGYLLDVLFLIPIWLPWYNYTLYAGNGLSKVLAYIMFYGGYFLYCFLSESIFRQTFGKIITNSCVVSNGINLTTGRVLIRTLCRYIPFDGFSFLANANWHDRLSSTGVVYTDSWEKVFEEVAETSEPKEKAGRYV